MSGGAPRSPGDPQLQLQSCGGRPPLVHQPGPCPSGHTAAKRCSATRPQRDLLACLVEALDQQHNAPPPALLPGAAGPQPMEPQQLLQHLDPRVLHKSSLCPGPKRARLERRPVTKLRFIPAGPRFGKGGRGRVIAVRQGGWRAGWRTGAELPPWTRFASHTTRPRMRHKERCRCWPYMGLPCPHLFHE